MADIKYAVIKEVSLETAMKASDKSTELGRSLAKQDSTVWNQTVGLVMQLMDFQGLELTATKDSVKDLSAKMKEHLAKYTMEQVVLPEEDYNDKGQVVKVCGKDGLPQWRTWAKTRRIWAYTSDIAKIVCCGQTELLYPEPLKVGARCDVLKECKMAQDALENIKRLAKDLDSWAEVVEGADADLAYDAVNEITVNNVEPQKEALCLVGKLHTAVKGIEDKDQKDAIRLALMAVVKELA